VNTQAHPRPRIWLVIGDKLGDNAQARRVAETLGLPYETRRLLPREKYARGKPRFRASLAHLDMQRSDPLQPPWPDLVITVGRRHAMAALWIKAQSPDTRIVLLGRPRRWIERFDLVIVPPQYAVPAAPNVLQLWLPLLHVDPQSIGTAVEQYRAELAGLARPLIAVLVGGATRPLRFDTQVALKLADQCRHLQQELGGSLYFSTSRRTPEQVSATLERHLPEHAVLHRWSSDSRRNPYLALLGLADYFVVTGDSVSMMMEVALTGKPLAIFPLPSHPAGRLWQRLKAGMGTDAAGDGSHRISAAVARLMYLSGVTGFGRDLTRFHTRLIDAGYAVMAGQTFAKTSPGPDELLARQQQNVRSRILALLPASPPDV